MAPPCKACPDGGKREKGIHEGEGEKRSVLNWVYIAAAAVSFSFYYQTKETPTYSLQPSPAMLGTFSSPFK